MKFAARIILEFEGEDEKDAQDILLDYIKNGFKQPCMLEVAQIPDPKEKQNPGISFKDLLESLNEDDMNQA